MFLGTNQESRTDIILSSGSVTNDLTASEEMSLFKDATISAMVMTKPQTQGSLAVHVRHWQAWERVLEDTGVFLNIAMDAYQETGILKDDRRLERGW